MVSSTTSEARAVPMQIAAPWLEEEPSARLSATRQRRTVPPLCPTLMPAQTYLAVLLVTTESTRREFWYITTAPHVVFDGSEL